MALNWWRFRPDKPAFGALAATNLVIHNARDIISLKLTCPSDPGAR